MRLGAAARTVRDGFSETLAYTDFPPEHWRRIRTNNGIERINREIRRRTRSRRDLPGRQLGPDAGDGEAEVHRGARMGQEEVPDMSKLEEMDELSKKAEG